MNDTAISKRAEQFMPRGVPRYIRVYDNGGKSADRYSVVFTGRYRDKTHGQFWSLHMSESPFWPQGVGQHGSSDHQIDVPNYGHLGKKIKFQDLPADCQVLVVKEYAYLWDILPGEPSVNDARDLMQRFKKSPAVKMAV